MTDFVSPKDLANAIGASESSLKRWVDGGLLGVHRTAGGHRRIPVTEAVHFIRTRKLKVVRPDLLGLSPALELDAEMSADQEHGDRLLSHLTEGKLVQARGLITTLFLQGTPIAQIADGPILHALEEIGKIWRHDREGILIEHRALEACISAVNVLLPLLAPNISEKPMCAIGSSLPNDPYILPNILVTAVLTECGFNPTNLGANLPISLLCSEARRLRPSLVWVSASVVDDSKSSSSELDELAREVLAWNGTLAIGGREAHRLQLSDSDAISLCSNMEELAALAQRIQAATAAESSAS
ncbi:MAG: hypothetical protein P8J45_06095 [Phycisphaerales bacterium]|nr:hypothetical protein [Phycisphaerales bacterium]